MKNMHLNNVRTSSDGNRRISAGTKDSANSRSNNAVKKSNGAGRSNNGVKKRNAAGRNNNAHIANQPKPTITKLSTLIQV